MTIENKRLTIQKTAKDYDMSYNDVECFYNHYYDDGMFYRMLEEHIKSRRRE